MTGRLENPQSRTDRARKANTPWRTKTIRKPDNKTAQREARKRLTEFEAACGETLEAFEGRMSVQRERVRRRYGVKP